jgi:hypothetical protein
VGALVGVLSSMVLQQVGEALRERRRVRATATDFYRQVDLDLRERRLAAYTALWQLLGPIAVYRSVGSDPPEDLLTQLQASLIDWYDSNGLLLSRSSARIWWALVTTCETPDPNDDAIERARKLASLLRTSLAEDINSRGAVLAAPTSRELEAAAAAQGVTLPPP